MSFKMTRDTGAASQRIGANSARLRAMVRTGALDTLSVEMLHVFFCASAGADGRHEQNMERDIYTLARRFARIPDLITECTQSRSNHIRG